MEVEVMKRIALDLYNLISQHRCIGEHLKLPTKSILPPTILPTQWLSHSTMIINQNP